MHFLFLVGMNCFDISAKNGEFPVNIAHFNHSPRIKAFILKQLETVELKTDDQDLKSYIVLTKISL